MYDWEERISVDPDVCHGQPCLRGSRIMVRLIIELLAAGVSCEEILSNYYPQLTEEDVTACLRYAASMLVGSTEPVPA